MHLIVASEDQLTEIIRKCLRDNAPAPQQAFAPDPPQYLHSLKELAVFLHCSVVTAQKLKNSGKIRFRQFGRKCIFNTAEVLDDLNRNRVNIKKKR